MERFRYAPTPSRPLHLGNALAALVGWGAARAAGGAFVLRIEDIDRSRCRDEFERAALEDLRWLGLDWDEGPDVGGSYGPYRQSERLDRYDAALSRLGAADMAYICRCSRADIRAAQSAPHTQEGGEIPYPGTCRPKPQDGAPGHTSVLDDRGGYRLHVARLGARAKVSWQDAWVGANDEDVRETCGDFLLGRPQAPTYQLAVVADDIAMGITHVVRGRDLLGSTARQILLFEALGATAPSGGFAHHPLLLGGDGRKLSKRDEASTLGELRAGGLAPERLIARLGVRVGLWPETIERATPADVADVLRRAAPDPPPWRDAMWSRGDEVGP